MKNIFKKIGQAILFVLKFIILILFGFIYLILKMFWILFKGLSILNQFITKLFGLIVQRVSPFN